MLDQARNAKLSSDGSDKHEREIEGANLLANLGIHSAAGYQFQRAERYLAEGLAYIAERDIDTFRPFLLAAQAINKLCLGDWNEAGGLAGEVL